MGVATTFELNQTIDELVSYYLRLKGTSAAAYGVGEAGDTYGCADRAADLETEIATIFTTFDWIRDIGHAAADLTTGTSAKKMAAARLRRLFQRIEAHIRREAGSSYPTINSYLKFLNVDDSTKWQALQDFNFRDLYYQIFGTYPSAYNCYQEILQGATYANALAKLTVGTGVTDGVAVDSTKYAGGIPCVKVSGFAGSSDTVTVTGDFFDPATETTETGKTATFTVSANGRFYRVAGNAAANALIYNVTNVTAGANITAPTIIYVEAERPDIRTATAQAGAATTITLDNSASAVDDIYNGFQIGHTGDKYTLRTITDYDGSTKVATVNSAWATNPTGSDTFKILRAQLPL